MKADFRSAAGALSYTANMEFLPRPSSYPLLRPKYPLLGNICLHLKVLGVPWYKLFERTADGGSALFWGGV